jgi:hypothetical protein
MAQFRELSNQGCQIFLDKKYQNGDNITNGHNKFHEVSIRVVRFFIDKKYQNGDNITNGHNKHPADIK